MVFQDKQRIGFLGPLILSLSQQWEDELSRLLDVLMDFLLRKHPCHGGNVVAPIKQFDHCGRPVLSNLPVVGSERVAFHMGQPFGNKAALAGATNDHAKNVFFLFDIFL